VKKFNAGDVAEKGVFLKKVHQTLSKPSHMTCQNALDSWRAAKACNTRKQQEARRLAFLSTIYNRKYYVLLYRHR